MDKLIRYHDIKTTPLSGNFIVTEKIHGSNFGIGYIKNSLRIQSRNRIIDKHFNQFGLSEIIEPLIQIVEKAKGILKYSFLIYGEIFGKTFPVMNYYDSRSVKAFGSKNVFFRAFDLYNADENTYLKYSDAIALFIKVGLPYLPILNINYENTDYLYIIVEKYQSTFSDEIVEGFVLKKDENELSGSRNIFKVVRKKFRGSEVPLINKNKIKSYVNYNRFISAYSKIGNDSEKIKQEMLRDSLEDMMFVIRNEIENEIKENYLRFHKKLQDRKREVN